MPRKNDIVTLEITDMTHEGSGVGHLDGMAVFVPGAVTGDLLSVQLVKICNSHCFGRLLQIVTPSPDRIEPDCPVSRRCGGCAFRHITYESELRFKQSSVEQNMRRIGKIELCSEPIIPSPDVDGYRNKAQYPVRMQRGELCAGFFAPRSHEVIDCHDCKLQPPVFRELLETVLTFVRDFEISVYDERTHVGLLRHVYLRRGTNSGEIMVCLVLNGTVLPHSDELTVRLCATDKSVVSVLINENASNTNVILGESSRVLFGKPAISDTLCGVSFELSPHAFYQVNSRCAQLLYELAADYAALSETDTLLDLYCGVGTIGLSLASRCKSVIGVEIVPEAVENAKANAAKNGILNARFICADAAQAAARLEAENVRPDVIILDPPRRGCDATLLESAAGMSPRKIVMISCNSATMARDCAMLGTLGYSVSRFRPVDMFPRTGHVECVTELLQTR